MKNIAIIMGGYSSEYKISLVSGNVVYQFLDKTKFVGFRIHIFKEKMDLKIREGFLSKFMPLYLDNLLKQVDNLE